MSQMESVVGAVDGVKGHYVATVFLGLGVPLIPIKSMYVHSMQMTRLPGGTRITYQGRDLPLVWSSVVLGFLRVWLGLATFAMPFVLMWGQSVDFSNWTRWECLATYATAILWALTLVPGRLSAEKQKQLVWLGEATGSYFDPRRDGMLGRKGVCAMLEPNLRGWKVEPDVASLRAAIGRADAKLLGQIYAYARYAAPDEPDYAPVVDEAWARILTLG
jgi:hypothetical protein